MAISDKKREELKRVFRRFDMDGDNKISASELSFFMLNTIGEETSLVEAEDLIASINMDGSEALDLDGFIRLVEGIKGSEEDEDRDMFEAFKMYAMEGEGQITADSLKWTLGRLGIKKDIEECREMIARFDLDGDEVLSFEEFKAMMML